MHSPFLGGCGIKSTPVLRCSQNICKSKFYRLFPKLVCSRRFIRHGEMFIILLAEFHISSMCFLRGKTT